MTSRRACTSAGSSAASGLSLAGRRRDEALADPRVQQRGTEVARGGDEKGGRPDGDVGDLEREQLVGGAVHPLRGVGRVQRADAVEQRLQRVAHDLLGQLARRVVGSGRAPQRRLRHVQRAGQHDDGQLAQVGAQQAVERQEPLGQRVVATGDGQELLAGLLLLARRKRGQALLQRLRRADPGRLAALGQLGREHRAAAEAGGEVLQLGERDLLLAAGLADQADDRPVGPEPLVGQQALVDVADLLHVELAERQGAALAAAAAADLDVLHRAQHVQHGPVVDRPRQPQVGLRVEQRPVQRGHPQPRVVDPAVHGLEQRQQSVPRLRGVLQLVLAALPRPRLQRGAQGGGRVGARVEVVVAGQQAAFLGEEQEHHPHHHRHRAAVDLVRVDELQARAAALALPDVGAPDRGHEQLDGPAHLHAERLGDLLLAGLALRHQRDQPLVLGHPEEPAAAQQRAERPNDVPLGRLRPRHRVEHGGGRDLSAGRADERPPPPVGDEPELHTVEAAQVREAVDRRGRPGRVRNAGGRQDAGVTDEPEQRDGVGLDLLALGVRLDQRERGFEHRVVLGHRHGEAVEAAGPQRVAPAEQVAQQPGHPLLLPAGRVVAPPGVGAAQLLPLRRLDRVQRGPGGPQHRQGQERAVDVDEREPVAVVADGVVRGRAGPAPLPAGHRTASRRGTTNTTATGNRCGCGSA